MARWAFDDNVPRVRPRLRLGQAIAEEAATEPPPPRARAGKTSGDRDADAVKSRQAARESVEEAVDAEELTGPEFLEATESTGSPAPVEATEEAPPPVATREATPDTTGASEASSENAVDDSEDAGSIAEARAPSPSKSAIRSLIGAPAVAPESAVEPSIEADVETVTAGESESAAVVEDEPSIDALAAQALEAIQALEANQALQEPRATEASRESDGPEAVAEEAAGTPTIEASVQSAPAVEAAPTPTPTPTPAPPSPVGSTTSTQTNSTQTTTTSRPSSSTESRRDPETAFEAATRRSEIKRRASGLGAFVSAPPEVSLFDDLDPVGAATELAAELERALAEAQEANEQFRRDLSLALDDLARSTAEVKRLTERNGRLEAEARERTQVVQDLVQEMELLESERDGALARGSDAAIELESLREKLEFGERRVRELERQVSDAQARARRLEEANSAQAAQRAALRAEVESLRRERDELLGRNAELERERDELGRSKQALDEIHRALAEARQRAQRIRTR